MLRALLSRLDARLPRFIVTKRQRRVLATNLAVAVEAAIEAAALVDEREYPDAPRGYRTLGLQAFGRNL